MQEKQKSSQDFFENPWLPEVPWFRLALFAAVFAGFWLSLWGLVHLYTPEMPGFEVKPALPLAGGSGGTPALPDDPKEPLAIVIDPGHGGEDGGTQGHDILEKHGTLEISLALAKELRKRGHLVVLTREKDETVSLSARRDLANAKRRHCFVSIHLNHGDPRASGIETFFGWPKRPELVSALRTHFEIGPDAAFTDDRGRLLAEAIQRGAVAATGAQSREIRNERQILVLNSIHCPAVLVECGFVSNKTEAGRLKTETYQQKLASGLADGIELFIKETTANPRYGIP